jgi:hypothetical protein
MKSLHVQCGNCERFKSLFDKGECKNGICAITWRIEPAFFKESIWCKDFKRKEKK